MAFPASFIANGIITGPLNKIEDILEMIIESHAADAAVISYICDGDLIKRLLQQQMLE